MNTKQLAELRTKGYVFDEAYDRIAKRADEGEKWFEESRKTQEAAKTKRDEDAYRQRVLDTLIKRKELNNFPEGTIVLVGGNDFHSELSPITKTIYSELYQFFKKIKANINIKAFAADLTASSIMPIVNFVKKNHTPDTPLFIYGYSLGGLTANQAIKILQEDEVNVDLFYAVDAAIGIASSNMQISSNVERIINVYQTERSTPPVFSRGYPAEPIKGNTMTRITNINYDEYKSAKGSGAHGAMAKDTKVSVVLTFQNEMALLIGK